MHQFENIEVMISQEEVAGIVSRLGKEVSEEYKGISEDLVVIGLLRGSFVFMADLVRAIETPLVADFMAVSSYGDGTVSTRDVKVVMDLNTSIEGRDVLVVEDIVDTGNTFSKVLTMLENRSPRSLKVCSFLSKPSRREIEVPVDFCGKEIPDEFVIGYGLDYAQKYRNLPYVGILKV
ncbi:hypoxanthine phosphoribosyltransferase [Desulfotalea psychrophila]|uniref:Hypoxanthine phosphoribosyltransferase n=1 Tax=Desulfotalea psychrophila (strain LSv54 / DSM 12343) TaxID=177439 RepID=Q6AR46_DESPS|nr:hypoxanthine phosphoribosyltransferase [Desulfotalea psychrophila]CAG35178.1 probable hypoxanthine phosphoribosyltransferase [Desulfotalea psychrophila LSv54]